MRMIQLYGNGISKILRRIHLVGKVSIQKICGKTWKYATKVEAKREM